MYKTEKTETDTEEEDDDDDEEMPEKTGRHTIHRNTMADMSDTDQSGKWRITTSYRRRETGWE